jgi:hypothetical protein
MPSAGFDLDVGWMAEIAEEHWLLYAMAHVKVQIYDGAAALFHARPAQFQQLARFCPAHGFIANAITKPFQSRYWKRQTALRHRDAKRDTDQYEGAHARHVGKT